MAKSVGGAVRFRSSSMKEKKTKKKKKGAKSLLSAPDAAARKSAKPVKENPFESIWSRRKLDVMGKGRKAGERRLGLARSRGIEKRRKTLLKDYERSRKASMFVDNRIGELDGNLGEFDKGILRLQRQRQLKLKKENKYNLPDGEEDDKVLGQAEIFDDFQDEVPFDDEDEADHTGKGITAARYLNVDSMYNPMEQTLQDEEKKLKTKKEVMEEIIAKSKFFKAKKAMEKEEDDHLMEQLDKNFTSLLESKAFLSLSQEDKEAGSNTSASKGHTDGSVDKGLSTSTDRMSVKEQPDVYDKLVRVLPSEKRARPTDRKKTAEEIAQEERERLELLEEERQRRMHAGDDSDEENESDNGDEAHISMKKSRHVSGDDLGDSLSMNRDLLEKPGWVDDIIGQGKHKSEDDDASTGSQDNEEGGDDDNIDNASDRDEDDSDDSNAPSSVEWELSEDDLSMDREGTSKNLEAENAKASDSRCRRSQEAKGSWDAKVAFGKSHLVKKDSLPFVIEAPQNFTEFCSLIDNRPEEEIVEAINRIRVCNTVSLSAENRRKMQVFYGVLFQYFAVLSSRKSINVKLINMLVKPLVEMSVNTPYFAAICARERLMHIRNQFCADVRNAENSWPSLKTLLLLRIWSLTFPCSDFRHVVMTPATLLMCEYLMRCPIVTGKDTAVGSFLCSMVLSVAKQSLKFYPEVIMFIRLLLVSACETPRSEHLCQPVDLKKLPPWLFLNKPVPDIHRIDLFSIMSTPAESPLFSSDDFRASVLVSLVETVEGFVNIYEKFSSFPEIFLPVSSLLYQVIKQETVVGVLREKMTGIIELIKKKTEELHTVRQPLQMRKQKPAPIKLLNPKFEENFVRGVDYDPDRERVERKKLKKLLKEAKGATRELRKDNYFLHEVKERERLLHEEERAEMYGKARAFLQEQEHAFKSGQLGKGRKRRR